MLCTTAPQIGDSKTNISTCGVSSLACFTAACMPSTVLLLAVPTAAAFSAVVPSRPAWASKFPARSSKTYNKYFQQINSSNHICNHQRLLHLCMFLLTSTLLGASGGAVAATASSLIGVVVSLKTSDTSWVITSCMCCLKSW